MSQNGNFFRFNICRRKLGMLMTRIKALFKLMAVCLCMAIFANTPIVSYAANADDGNLVSPCYTYIYSTGVGLVISPEGVATITATVNGYPGVTESYVKCNLEKLMGSYWMQIKSFEDRQAGTYAGLSKTHQVDAGMYRVMLTAKCNNETATVYTSNQTYTGPN